jgi:hypothetical protein
MGKKLSQDEEKEVGILGTLFILWCAIRKLPLSVIRHRLRQN